MIYNKICVKIQDYLMLYFFQLSNRQIKNMNKIATRRSIVVVVLYLYKGRKAAIWDHVSICSMLK